MITTAGVTLLLALYLVMSLGASLHKGMSYDEGEQLGVGYNVWLNGDFRMESADGDLIKRWATLPYLLTRPHGAPTNNTAWYEARAYAFGSEFFFDAGNAEGWLLLQGRTMAALLGVMCGLLVFYCSRELFGVRGGFISLFLFAFSPSMLAFGALVSTDMSACLVLLGATWAVWRLLHRVTWGRLALSLVFSSLLLLAKMSTMVIFPIALILVLVKLLSEQPTEWWLGRKRMITAWPAQAGVFAGLFAMHVLVAWTALWAHYDFRFSARANPANTALKLINYDITDPVSPKVSALMSNLKGWHLLPEGFLHGVRGLLANNEGREAFLDGQWYFGGRSDFFLRAIWYKTPPELFLLLALGLVCWGLRRWSLKHQQGAGVPAGDGVRAEPSLLYRCMPFFVLIIVYFTTASIHDVDIGHRHILPIYPPAYVLAGSLALVWRGARQWAQMAFSILLLGLAFESLSIYPDYLAYFSPLAGGPAKAYQHLVDSSVDWGMNLPQVKTWLDQNNSGNLQPVFLGYFGIDKPEYYGIKCSLLVADPDWTPTPITQYKPGIYIISETYFQSDCIGVFGPWNEAYEWKYQAARKNISKINALLQRGGEINQATKDAAEKILRQNLINADELRFSRLCAWLRNNRPTPDARCGYSMFVWRLSAVDLNSAFDGPAPELLNPPQR